MGPVPAAHFNQASFIAQIDEHILKQGLDYVWVDLSGLDKATADAVRAYATGPKFTGLVKPKILLYL